MNNQTVVELATIDEKKPLSPEHIPAGPAILSPSPPNLPLPNLLTDETREDYINIGVPLYEASITCDWKAAEAIIKKNPDLVRYSITENCETALHVAASAKNTKHAEEFVKNLVGYMRTEDLELQNKNHNTALYLAAAAGNDKTVEILVKKNMALLTILGGGGQMMPLYAAALFGNKDVAKYLYDNSHKLRDDGWTAQNRGWLLEKCVETDMFDIALQILKDDPKLASTAGSVLGVLARKPEAFFETKSTIMGRTINNVFAVFGLKAGAPEKERPALQLLRVIWEEIVKKPKNEIDAILRGLPDAGPKDQTAKKKYSSRVLFIAAEMGNTKFLVELIRKYPDLIWKINDENHSIFHTAVKHRQEGIYNLLFELGAMKDLITPLKDENQNNMLHLVGKSAKAKRLQDVSGVALQMQRELLWFKEVQGMIPHSYRERKNKEGYTPHELFTKEHKDLVKKGEEWMKETANQCMVVAALIATIVFAAAFTVPGGYNQDDGIPFFYRKVTFMVFVMSDAISFSSSASILMFLSILTSRYAERDFLESLPKKLMLGLTTLFLSITSMMIAFSVSFFILYHQHLKWMPILVSLLAAMPVLLYVALQLPLLTDVFRSTYGSRYLFKPTKRVLYYEN